MHCEKCGNQLKQTAAFCGSCGNPVSQNNTQQAPKKTTLPIKPIFVGISTFVAVAIITVVAVFFPFWEDSADQVIGEYSMENTQTATATAPTLEPLVAEVEEILEIPDYVIIGGLEYSTAETVLYLNNAQLTSSDIEPLRYMVNLEYLVLWWNVITDITPLAGLTNLQSLDLMDNEISSLAPLADLVNLTWLNLHNTQTNDLTVIAGLTNLEWLNVMDNSVTNIEPLATLANLADLNLSFNNITDITLLANLTNLTHLSLSSNQITDITPLENLANLTMVDLSFNNIEDWSPVAHVETVHGRPENWQNGSQSVIQALRGAIAQYNDIISALTENHWTFFDTPFYHTYRTYDIFNNGVPVLVIEYFGMMGPENSRLLQYVNGAYITVDNFDHSLNFFRDQQHRLILAVAHSPGDTARLEYFFVDENFNLTPLATILSMHVGADFMFDAINHQTGEASVQLNPSLDSVDRYLFSHEQIFGMPDIVLTAEPPIFIE